MKIQQHPLLIVCALLWACTAASPRSAHAQMLGVTVEVDTPSLEEVAPEPAPKGTAKEPAPAAEAPAVEAPAAESPAAETPKETASEPNKLEAAPQECVGDKKLICWLRQEIVCC